MENFYPRLFKKLNEVSASAIKDWVATTPNSDIRIDPNVDDDEIISVDRINKDDIITKNYINSIKKTKVKNDMMKFLSETNPEITLDNVDEFKIPFKNFWKYQVDMYKYEKGGGSEEETEEPEEYEIQTATNIDPKSIQKLSEFFNANGKKQEFDIFVKNIPNGAIRHQIDRLFQFMVKVVEGKEDTLSEKLFDYKLNLSKSDQDQWKKDMVNYLYSMQDIEEMSQNDFYSSQVLNKNTFIRSIFDIKAPGIGRGELMMCYLFHGAKAAGGDVDYDLVFYNGRTYEVKEYLANKEGKASSDSAGESIRLGKGGKAGQFECFENVYESVIWAKRLFREYSKELEQSLNPIFYKLWTYMQNSHMQGKSYDKVIAMAVGTGELSNANLNRIILWNYFANDLINRPNPSVPPKVISKLSDLYYVNHPDKLKDDFDRAPQQYFQENKGLDAFVIFRPTKINICRAEDLKYATISQAGFKFIERGEDKKQPSIADAAYSKWKAEIDKAMKSGDKEDRESLKNVQNNISFADFYEKEGYQEHLAKVEKKEEIKLSKDIKAWEKSHQSKLNAIEKAKSPAGKQKATDELNAWMKEHPKPGVSESFYPRLNEWRN